MAGKGVVLGLLVASVAVSSAGATRIVVADPQLTPGTRNPAVTQATISRTICVKNWTATIRPPSSWTTALKIRQMRAYHLHGDPANYEEDHLISLELGGAPKDERNLWPEPQPRAGDVDRIETSLKRAVCDGTMKLRAAQREIVRLKQTQG
jgi:hypothetical protein